MTKPSREAATIMADYQNDHGACVNAWMKRAGADPNAEDLIRLFAAGFAEVWARTHRTLGDITLAAIVDRVLYTATERFPFLEPVRVEAGKVDLEALRARASDLELPQVTEGIRFFMVEFLTVLGNLTADILTPGLHLELSRSASVSRDRTAKDSVGASSDAESNDEDAES